MNDNIKKALDHLNKKKKVNQDALKEEFEEEDIEEEEETEEEDIEEEEDEDEGEDLEDVEEIPKKKKKKAVKKKIEKKKTLSDEELEKIKARDMEALQNNGIYRYELLSVLTLISNHLHTLNSMIYKITKE